MGRLRDYFLRGIFVALLAGGAFGALSIARTIQNWPEWLSLPVGWLALFLCLGIAGVIGEAIYRRFDRPSGAKQSTPPSQVASVIQKVREDIARGYVPKKRTHPPIHPPPARKQ